MIFCTNCGQEIAENAKFCPNCGAKINRTQIDVDDKRKMVFEGEIHKCPNCGEVLKSFEFNCPACGHEIRGAKSSTSINEFALKIASAKTTKQKISIIRNFPIPNTKEDVLEFMILATTNLNTDQLLSDDEIKKDVSDAWFAKIEQSYQKAKLLFSKEKDFAKIQSIYKQTCDKVKKETFSNAILHTIGLWGGLIVFIMASILDIFTYSNTSVFHLGAGIMMVASAYKMNKRTKSFFKVIIGVICGLLSLLLGTLLDEFFYENGSAMVLAGGATLIIIVIRLITNTMNY